MQVQVQKLSPVLVELDVQIDADRVTKEIESAYQALAKNAMVRGFRRGKTPRRVLQHMFGARVAADVAQRLVDDTYPEAVGQQQVQPVGNPAIEPQPVEPGKAFVYKARVEVLPEVSGVQYEGLEAKRPRVEPTDEQIAEQLLAMRKMVATIEPVEEDRGARLGDVLTVDIEVSVDGQVVAEASTTDFAAELEEKNLIPAIHDALLEKRAGDVVEVDVSMPSAHPVPALRGKTAHFRITVKEQKQRVLPAEDDEFAKDVGDFETFEALRASVVERIRQSLKERSDNAVAEQLVAELVKKNALQVPESLVRQQMQVTEREILARARQQGQQVTGLGAEMRQQVRVDSEVKVRAGLLMAAIAREQGIKIGEKEIDEALEELSQQTGKNVAKLRAEYSGQRREMLIGMILENKVLDIIEEKAHITDETGPGGAPEGASPAAESGAPAAPEGSTGDDATT